MKHMSLSLILLVFILFLSACNQNAEHPYTQNIEGIDDFPYEFKLPIHMPYEVERVSLFHYDQRTVELPKKLDDLKPLDFNLVVSLRGNLEEKEIITIEISPEGVTFGGFGLEQLKLSNGVEAHYSLNENAQILSWNDDGLTYSMTVHLPEKDKALYSQEELIKIADSFAPYYKPE